MFCVEQVFFDVRTVMFDIIGTGIGRLVSPLFYCAVDAHSAPSTSGLVLDLSKWLMAFIGCHMVFHHFTVKVFW